MRAAQIHEDASETAEEEEEVFDDDLPDFLLFLAVLSFLSLGGKACHTNRVTIGFPIKKLPGQLLRMHD